MTDTSHLGTETTDRDQAGIQEIAIEIGYEIGTEIEDQEEIKTRRGREITIVSAKKEILQDAMVTLVISVETIHMIVIIHMIVMTHRREDYLMIEKKESAFFWFELGKHTIEYHG